MGVVRASLQNLPLRIRRGVPAPVTTVNTAVTHAGKLLKVRVTTRSSDSGAARAAGVQAALRAALGEVSSGRSASAQQRKAIERRLDQVAGVLSGLPRQLTDAGAAVTFKEEQNARQVVTELIVPEEAVQETVEGLAVSDKAVLVRVNETVDKQLPNGEAGSPVPPTLFDLLQKLGYETFTDDPAHPMGEDPLRATALDSLAAWVVVVRVTTRALPKLEDISRYASRAEAEIRNLRTGQVMQTVRTGEVEGTGTADLIAADDARTRVAKKLGQALEKRLASTRATHVVVSVPDEDAELVTAMKRALDGPSTGGPAIVSTTPGPQGLQLEVTAPDGLAALAALLRQALPNTSVVAPGKLEGTVGTSAIRNSAAF